MNEAFSMKRASGAFKKYINKNQVSLKDFDGLGSETESKSLYVRFIKSAMETALRDINYLEYFPNVKKWASKYENVDISTKLETFWKASLKNEAREFGEYLSAKFDYNVIHLMAAINSLIIPQGFEDIDFDESSLSESTITDSDQLLEAYYNAIDFSEDMPTVIFDRGSNYDPYQWNIDPTRTYEVLLMDMGYVTIKGATSNIQLPRTCWKMSNNKY